MTSPGKHGKTNQSPTPQTHWWNWGGGGQAMGRVAANSVQGETGCEPTRVGWAWITVGGWRQGVLPCSHPWVPSLGLRW